MKDVVSECPIEEAMRVLSGRWPTLLLYYLKDGTKRFSDLRRDNPTVSHRILTLELRKLEQAGIVSRQDHPGYPRRVDYSLTPLGRTATQRLLDVIICVEEQMPEIMAARLRYDEAKSRAAGPG